MVAVASGELNGVTVKGTEEIIKLLEGPASQVLGQEELAFPIPVPFPGQT